jgi:hypothetical protein
MRTAAAAAFYLGYGLVLLGCVRVSLDAVRRRDRARLEVLLAFSLLLGDPILRAVFPSIPLIRFLPCVLLLLVRQFRPIRIGLDRAHVCRGLGHADGGGCRPRSSELDRPVVSDARCGGNAHRGVSWQSATRGRCQGAPNSSGCDRFWSAGRVVCRVEPVRLVCSAQHDGSSHFATMQGVALICYYFAFATPRPLLSRWRRAEQHRYLGTVMEREPEEREASRA